MKVATAVHGFVLCFAIATVAIGCGRDRSGRGGAKTGDGGPRMMTEHLGGPDGSEAPAPATGRCVGEAHGCARVAAGYCLGQAGCYPTDVCSGDEIDCATVPIDSCASYRHCYEDTVEVFGAPMPVCRSYDDDCERGVAPNCEGYGGTCATVSACGGTAESCESRDDADSCRAHDGCSWITTLAS